MCPQGLYKRKQDRRCYVAGFKDGGKGHRTKEMQAASEAGKGKETDCSLECPEGTQPCGPILDF